MADIFLTPFVSSIIPEIILDEKSVGILNIFKIGLIIIHNKSSKWLLFSIEIITENKTTKPPIIITVEIALLILKLKTSPKLEKVASFFTEVFDSFCIVL